MGRLTDIVTELIEFEKSIIKNEIEKSRSEIHSQFKDNVDLFQKAYLQGLISDDMIEKAWKKHPIGSVVRRKDGRQYRKISETGDSEKDWQVINDKQSKVESPENAINKEGKHQEGNNTKLSEEELKQHAKNTSETALQSAIKNSSDPEIRQTAHEELDRREKEEKTQEEEKGWKEISENKSENEHLEKFRTLSDDQIKFYLDAPYPKVKEAAKMVADERGLKLISNSEYEKEFEDYSDKEPNSADSELSKKYDKDSEKIQKYIDDTPGVEDSVGKYVGSAYKAIRLFLTDKNQYKNSSYTYSDDKINKIVNDLSTLISKNKIDSNLTLYRSVKSIDGDFFSKLQKGDIYEDKSFSSTSLKKISFGNFKIKILAKKGSSVANLDNKDEFEYLIDKGSKFRVVEKKEDGITVELL